MDDSSDEEAAAATYILLRMMRQQRKTKNCLGAAVDNAKICFYITTGWPKKSKPLYQIIR